MGGVAKVGLLFAMAALVVLALVAGSIYVVYAMSESRLTQTIDAPRESITVPTDLSSVQYGQHLAGAVTLCTSCHGNNMAGRVMRDDQAARIVAPNLTRGRNGVGATLSDMDLARAIRHGVSPAGRPLLMMPTDDYGRLSDTDLGAILAFIRSLPAVDSTLPTNEVRGLGRLQLATGRLTLLTAASADASTPRSQPASLGLTPEYGAYLTTIAGCGTCHGIALAGGQRGPNITLSGLTDWSDTDFLRAMRTGRRPDGRALDPAMPWVYYAQMTELELRAIWSFLQVIPPTSRSG